MKEISDLQSICSQVRRDIVRMVHANQSGHPGGSLGCVELLVALYFDHMYHSATFSMEAKGEDVFFLSNGHISPVWYSVLARSGYFPVEELSSFRSINSRLQGHPTTHEGLPGVRIASGSLGQGLSVAIGMAEIKRLENDTKEVFCLMGDGELQEGQVWEAALYAAGKKLSNLVACIDLNGQQIDGSTEDVLPMGNIGEKFSSFGWHVIDVRDGNSVSAILQGLRQAREWKIGPVVLILHTEMGKGIDFMEGTHKWHGIAPNDDQLKDALSQLPETLGDY